MPSKSSRSAAYDHIALDMRAIRSICNAMIWCTSSRPDRAPATLLANVGGSSLHLVEVAASSAASWRARARWRWSNSRATGWLAVRLRRQARDQAQPCHQLGADPLRARGHVGGGDRQVPSAQILMEPMPAESGSPAKRCTKRNGHGQWGLGIGHARGRSGAAQIWRAERAGRGQAGAPAAR